MVKEKNEYSIFFLILFLLIPSINFQTTYPFWNTIFTLQASLKTIIFVYLVFTIFFPKKMKLNNRLLSIVVYAFYFLPLLLFKMFIAFQ